MKEEKRFLLGCLLWILIILLINGCVNTIEKGIDAYKRSKEWNLNFWEEFFSDHDYAYYYLNYTIPKQHEELLKREGYTQEQWDSIEKSNEEAKRIEDSIKQADKFKNNHYSSPTYNYNYDDEDDEDDEDANTWFRGSDDDDEYYEYDYHE